MDTQWYMSMCTCFHSGGPSLTLHSVVASASATPQSRPLHLSRISSSYALGGAPTATGDDGEDSSHTGIGGVTSHALPPDLLAAAAAEEEENEFDRMEEGAGGGEIDEGAPDEHDGDNEHISREELAEGGADQEHDQEGETDHSHAGAAYQTATEIGTLWSSAGEVHTPAGS